MQQDTTQYKSVQFVLLATLIANVMVAVFKIVVGTIINSASMTADGFHSISDGTSNIVALIAIKLSSKPEDDKHPYGHFKIEIITGMMIGILLTFVGLNIIYQAVPKLKNPVAPNVTPASITVLLITFFVNIFVAVYEHKKGIQLKSTLLTTDAEHTKSDIFVTIGVLITLILLKFGLPPILDPIVSLFVSIAIFHSAYEVLKENINILIDAKVVDENEIKNIALSFEGVKTVHKIRSRGTKSHVFIDMHIMVDPNMTVSQSHTLDHNMEKKLRQKLGIDTHLLLHIEPYSDNPNEVED